MGVVVLSAGTGLRPSYLSKEKASKLFFQLTEKASGIIHSDEVCYLYAFITFILEHLSSDSLDTVKHGRVFSPSFRWLRASYDYFLTQEGRIQQWLNRDSYVKEMARLGFTHIEINGLASPTS